MTIWLARRDRKDAEMARADDLKRHERDLIEQRELSVRQVREERAEAERVRLRERQVIAVAGLLDRISGIRPYLSQIPGIQWKAMDPEAPGWNAQASAVNADPLSGGYVEAVRWLRRGISTDAFALADQGAADQYRTLVHLVDTAAQAGYAEKVRHAVSRDLNRYAVFVCLSLESLANTGSVLDPGFPSCPGIQRDDDDSELWQPQPVPLGFIGMLQADPFDPMYRPAA
ncbi:MAG TPA: hypothetical protein VFQ44_30200 [Streptosporangiaceae bacterium]|nr:hypothetical protein [Streptosporangiaceae bacterium]